MTAGMARTLSRAHLGHSLWLLQSDVGGRRRILSDSGSSGYRDPARSVGPVRGAVG